MTILSVTRMWSRHSGEASSSDGQKKERTISDSYQVVCSPGTNALEVLAHAEVPSEGDAYVDNPYLRVKTVSPERVSPILFIVHVESGGEVGPGGEEDHPTNKPPEFHLSSIESDEPIDHDFYGDPLVTATGEPINGVTKKVYDRVLRVKRNYLFFDDYATQLYLESVSSDAITIGGSTYPAGCAHLKSFAAHPIVNNGLINYWEIEAEVLLRRGIRVADEYAWHTRLLNVGFYERVGAVAAITGGAGQGATAIVEVAAGMVSAVRVTNKGEGYTSTPSVAITGGGGSSATATATVTDGRVVSIAVGAAGSGYFSGEQLCLDKNKQPMTKPSCLKLTGEREKNPANAAFLLKRKFGKLPYAALGLFS